MSDLTINLVIHCTASEGSDDNQYGINGWLATDLANQAGVKIEAQSFTGDLTQQLPAFLAACERADLLLVDAWSHPAGNDWIQDRSFDPQQNQATAIRQVCSRFPHLPIFAELMEGVRKVAVHNLPNVKPHQHWLDEEVVSTIKNIATMKYGQIKSPSEVHADALSILVIDDSASHRLSARQTLAGHKVVIVSSYDDAVTYLTGKHQFDVVLTDMLMPASAEQQGEGTKFVGQEMAVGFPLLFLAAKSGAKSIAMVTDTSHHAHPMSACLDRIHFKDGDSDVSTFTLNGAKCLLFHSPMLRINDPSSGNEIWAKDWGKVLECLLSQ